MLGVTVTSKVFREDFDLPAYGIVEPTFHNKGTANVIIDAVNEISPGKKDYIPTAHLPMLNEYITIRFEGNGTKELVMTYGKIGEFDCSKI